MFLESIGGLGADSSAFEMYSLSFAIVGPCPLNVEMLRLKVSFKTGISRSYNASISSRDSSASADSGCVNIFSSTEGTYFETMLSHCMSSLYDGELPNQVADSSKSKLVSWQLFLETLL